MIVTLWTIVPQEKLVKFGFKIALRIAAIMEAANFEIRIQMILLKRASLPIILVILSVFANLVGLVICVNGTSKNILTD